MNTKLAKRRSTIIQSTHKTARNDAQLSKNYQDFQIKIYQKNINKNVSKTWHLKNTPFCCGGFRETKKTITRAKKNHRTTFCSKTHAPTGLLQKKFVSARLNQDYVRYVLGPRCLNSGGVSLRGSVPVLELVKISLVCCEQCTPRAQCWEEEPWEAWLRKIQGCWWGPRGDMGRDKKGVNTMF